MNKIHFALILAATLFLNSYIPAVAVDANSIFAAVGQKNYGKYECEYSIIENGLAQKGICTIIKSKARSSVSGCEKLKTNFVVIAAIKNGKCKFTPAAN